MGDKLKAKDMSLLGQILAAVWVAGWSAAKFAKGGIVNASINDIMISGVSIAACFTPVYLSIVLDKIFGGKAESASSREEQKEN
jgi:hypothetical protein